MKRHAIVAAMALLALSQMGFAQVKITGCVAASTTVKAADLASRTPVTEKVRIAASNGRYRATFEAAGPSLWSVLEAIGIKKQSDDGFNRPIDLLVVVKGRGGDEALFSIGELHMGTQGARVLLAHRLRLIMPHHHEDVPPLADGDGWLTVTNRRSLEIPQACAECHAASEAPAIDLPRGLCVIAAGDAWPPRFIEDVVEISVRQLGVKVPPGAKKGAKAGEAVSLVRLDGSMVMLHPAALNALGTSTFSDATFGMGRGFHGIHTWQGVPLASLVAAHVPTGAILDRLWVLVTAADGYRTVLSGTELFSNSSSPLLATTEDGHSLGERGPMRLVVPGDFYIDRSVHSVQEVRLGILEE